MILCAILSFIYFSSNIRVYAATEYYVDLPIQEDTYIEENYPTVAPWNNRNWYIGTDTYYTKGKTRTLIHIDTAKLRDQNILISDIVDAKLVANAYFYEGTSTSVTIDSYTTTTPWSMYTTTWQLQPSISTKKDSSLVTTTDGKKEITVTNALKDIYTNSLQQRGILLKVNPETSKALVFWAHGCDLAPTPPQCESSMRPFLRVFFTKNILPTTCSLKFPNVAITNNSEVELQAQTSVDPEGEKITYKARICNTSDCAQVTWEDTISSTTKTTVTLPDSKNFLFCEALDEHFTENWGEPQYLEIDTIPPQPPQIIDEPQYSGSKTNILYWHENTDCAQYQVMSSERSTFSSYNTYSPWIAALSYSFEHIKEKPFYYRVKCKDNASNESPWSESTTTIIDSTLPAINYFKTNKTLISPSATKNGIEGSSYIQGSITDQTVKDLQITAYDTQDLPVFNASTSDKSYLWIHWPDKLGYIDGRYRLVLTGTDALDRTIQSDPIFITIDTTPPSPPTFTSIVDKKVFTTSKVSFSTACIGNDSETVYLSNKIIAQDKSKHYIELTLSDATRTLKALCKDSAGNVSIAEISFTVDTTPPQVPALTLTVGKDQQVFAKVYCREQGKVQYLNRGILLKESTCDKEKYSEISFTPVSSMSQIVTVNARVSDTVGNWSALAERSILYDTENNEKPFHSKCAVTYNIDTQQTVTKSCTWPQTFLATYIETVENSDHTFGSRFNINKYQVDTSVAITLIGCKSKSIWDPRTWFSCVTEHLSEQVATGFFAPSFKSSVPLYNMSESSIVATHQRSESLSITEGSYVTFSARLDDKDLTQTIQSPNTTTTVQLKYATNKQHAYLSWLFTKTVEVSQWHGNTSYQKPHAGIDFSVYKETIIVPADGKIVAASYSKMSECAAGGYYLALKHANGLFTYYFHLASINNPKGVAWKVGDTVKTGTTFAITGNSGKYNCEPLAYHLHFEVRTGQDPKSHVNPVPYITTNWSAIRTAKIDKYPGRLTGDNPHPKY